MEVDARVGTTWAPDDDRRSKLDIGDEQNLTRGCCNLGTEQVRELVAIPNEVSESLVALYREVVGHPDRSDPSVNGASENGFGVRVEVVAEPAIEL